MPSLLRIGSKRYTVARDDAACDQVAGDLGFSVDGASNAAHAMIVLREGRPHDSDAETLLHEILHQCFRASGCWPDDIKPGRSGVTVEEQLVAALTGPLLGVLRDNPALVSFVTRADHV